MICPCICSSRSQTIKISTPDGYQNPPTNLICPTCYKVSATEYHRKKKWCEICFCCCIYCGESDPCLICNSCGNEIGCLNVFRCKNCHIATPYNSNYCPKCGKHK